MKTADFNQTKVYPAWQNAQDIQQLWAMGMAVSMPPCYSRTFQYAVVMALLSCLRKDLSNDKGSFKKLFHFKPSFCIDTLIRKINQLYLHREQEGRNILPPPINWAELRIACQEFIDAVNNEISKVLVNCDAVLVEHLPDDSAFEKCGGYAKFETHPAKNAI